MKKKLGILIPALLVAALVIGILIYTRPMQLSEICGGADINKIEAFQADYELHPEDELVQCTIGQDDPRFLTLTLLLAGQRYRRTVWNIFPETTKTHILQDGDFKWELGCVFPDLEMENGEHVSGTVIRVSDFYGKLEIQYLDRTWRCKTENAWIDAVMDAILAGA